MIPVTAAPGLTSSKTGDNIIRLAPVSRNRTYPGRAMIVSRTLSNAGFSHAKSLRCRCVAQFPIPKSSPPMQSSRAQQYYLLGLASLLGATP